MNDVKRISPRVSQAQAVREQSIRTTNPMWLRRHFALVVAIIAILEFVVIVGGLLLCFLPHGQQINQNEYQAVYLSSGQVYFGKLQNSSGDYLVMTSPYTIESTGSSSASASSSGQQTLIKTSNGPYGPEDSIAIRTGFVAFWQNLTNDSKVSQAIKSKQ